MSRWAKFILAILLGIGAGMLYGWVINPVEYVDIAPDSLRMDYKTDYVLMVAEAYAVEADLGLAVRRLALLGDAAPADTVSQAAVFALEHDYPPPDLALIQALSEAVLTWNPSLEAPLP